MKFILNTDFITIGDLDNDSEILLKNIKSNRIFKISPIEYEIIVNYTKTNSLEDTFSFFAKTYDISKGMIDKIISFAKEYEFITGDSLKNSNQNKDYISNKFAAIFIWLFTMLRLDKLNLKFKMTSNFNLIKLLSWNIINQSSRFYSSFRKVQYLLFFTSLLFIPYFFNKIDIYYILYNIGEVKPYVLIIIALPLSLCISFLHEFSHFFTYKYFGGKQNEMGLALMYRFLPIFYTTTEDMVLWKSKKKRIYVALAGIINDLFFLSTFLVVHTFLENGIINSVLSFLIFGLIIKFFYNANPFAPGSDMYFIMSDLLNFESPFLKGHEMIKSLFKRKKADFNWVLLLYGFLCYISIFIYILAFFTLITLPFWINKIV